jgi:hypothetical protein
LFSNLDTLEVNTLKVLQFLTQPTKLLLILLAIVPMLPVVMYITNYREDIPYVDEWTQNAPVVIRAFDGQLTMADLLKPDAGHRTFFTNLTSSFFAVTTHWNLQIEAFVNVALFAVCAALLVYMVYRTEPGVALYAIAPISIAVFALTRRLNWYSVRASHWGFANVFVFAALLAVTGRQVKWHHILIAGVCAVAATFSMGNGMVVWPCIFLIFLFRRVRWMVLGVWSLTATLALIFYFHDLSISVGSGNYDIAVRSDVWWLENPLLLLRYLLLYVVNVLRPINIELDSLIWVPMVGLALLVLNLNVVFRSDQRQYTLLPWLGLGIFVVASALMTAASRANLGLEFAASQDQYGSVSALFWVVYLAFAIIAAFRHRTSASRAIRLLNILNVVFCIVLLSLYLYATYTVFVDAHNRWGFPATIPATRGETPDEACVRRAIFTRDLTCVVQQNPHEQDVVDDLAARRLALFADLDATNILPAWRTADSPILLQTPDAWRNLHTRDWLLTGIPETQFIHAVSLDDPLLPETQDFAGGLHTIVDVDAELEPSFESALTDEVWVVTSGVEGSFISAATEWLTTQGYVSIYADILLEPLPLRIAAYQRREPLREPLFLLDNNFALLDWQLLTDHRVAACGDVTLETVWRSDTAMLQLRRLSQTAVLAGADGVGVARADGPVASLPPERWQAGQVYVDRRSIELGCDTPPGEYALLTGLYDGETLQSLSATTASGEPTSNLIYLTTIIVE